MATGAKVRVEAPVGMAPLDIAQAVVGPHVLLKAEPVGSARTFAEDKALRQLSKRWEDAYKAQMAKLLDKLREYIEKHITLGALGKADAFNPGPPGRPQDLHALRQLIVDYHQAFIAGTLGPDTLTPADVQRLIDGGFLPQDLAFTFQPGAQELPPAAMAAIEHAYRYGHVLARAAVPYTGKQRALFREFRGKLSYAKFVEKWVPKSELAPAEEAAVSWASASAANEIVGLGNRVADNFATIAIEADREARERYMHVIRSEVEQGVERRETWRKVLSNIGHKMGDWSRDFGRIAATEMQTASQQGTVAAMIKRVGDPEEIMVAKQPNPDACPDCIRLHHTAGQGSPLRVFKLSELVANGSNIGRKRQAWKATVRPVHPWCGCELLEIPPGMVFDEEGNLVPELITRSDWLDYDLRKAGPFVGPRGGQYADAAHRISWKPHKRLTAQQAAAVVRAAHQQGKQAGHGSAAQEALTHKRGEHVLVHVPIEHLDTHFDGGYAPSPAERKRIAEYAGKKTEAPPIQIGHSARSAKRGKTSAFVIDGNHRVTAARQQGRKTVEAMMPAEDFERWERTHAALAKSLPKDPAKAPHLTYGKTVPDQGIVVRVGDPRMRAEIEKVIAQTPPEIFDKRVGVTLITTETPRAQNPLEEHDYAYWTGNEIRLMQTLPAHRIWRVLRHELGHSLNVYLMGTLGGVDNVRKWHTELWKVSKREGFVSQYATKMEIENAAEVTMMYLYYRQQFMVHFPSQFTFVHKAYRGIWENVESDAA